MSLILITVLFFKVLKTYRNRSTFFFLHFKIIFVLLIFSLFRPRYVNLGLSYKLGLRFELGCEWHLKLFAGVDKFGLEVSRYCMRMCRPAWWGTLKCQRKYEYLHLPTGLKRKSMTTTIKWMLPEYRHTPLTVKWLPGAVFIRFYKLYTIALKGQSLNLISKLSTSNHTPLHTHTPTH